MQERKTSFDCSSREVVTQTVKDCERFFKKNTKRDAMMNLDSRLLTERDCGCINILSDIIMLEDLRRSSFVTSI